MNGISLLLIERGEGVTTKKIPTSQEGCAGTAFVIFSNVKVPVENLLGKLNEGFKCIMYNFNHERWLMNCMGIGANRVIIDECFKWASLRMVFGKPLIDQPVIKYKLANMCAMAESCGNWLENITYQMTQMEYLEASVKLSGQIALLKYELTKSGELLSNEAAQIFGGRAITRTGMGKYIEKALRGYKFMAILGGSQEIMQDLGMNISQIYG